MAENATKCSAADGVTQTFDFRHGMPLMVRAVDFNALHAECQKLRKDADRSAGHSTGRRTYLSLKQIGEKFDISERTAHKLIAEAWFPAPVRLGPKVNRWIEDEVDTAVAARAPRRLEREPEPQRLALSRAARSQAAGAA